MKEEECMFCDCINGGLCLFCLVIATFLFAILYIIASRASVRLSSTVMNRISFLDRIRDKRYNN
jgi:hypothetical protein